MPIAARGAQLPRFVFVRVVTQVAIVVALTGHVAASGIACDRCVATIAGTRVVVTGTFSPVDFTARAPRWTIGRLVVRDVVVDAHDRGGAIRACATGTVGDARLGACAVLPRSLAALKQLRSIAVAWHVTSGGASGHGDARVAWAGDEIRLDTGVELALPAHIGALSLAGGTATAQISGTLSPLALSIAGRAHASTLELAPLRAHDLELPIDVRVALDDGALAITPQVPIAVHARDATIEAAST